jgi:dolichyl-phosphate-mannose-protein mannosyltransferase
MATEHGWLWGALLAGAVLRLGFPGRMVVEHFDEAVYASNVLFGAESNFQYPGREFYAPPLLPAAIEWLHIVWGLTGLPSPDWLPMVPALVCGLATIPSLWWIARSWFSPSAGVAAAWMLALCEFHAAYSRTTLTDVPLTFFLLWAVYWFGRAVETSSARAALIAGCLTAAAWWTKYSGWLPIAIAVTGTIGCLTLTRAARSAWFNAAGLCALGGVTAGLLWLPVLWDCQDVGGYAAVAANHRGYVEGWSAWYGNWRLQFEQHAGTYAGWATLVGLCGPTVWVFVSTIPRYGKWFRSNTEDKPIPTADGHRLFGLLINVGIMAWRPQSWLVIVVGTGIVCSTLALRRAVRDKNDSLALRSTLVGVWVTSLLIVTPLYHAYPRLLMPLVVGGILAGSVFWRREWVNFTASGAARRRWWLGPAVTLVLVVSCLGVRGSMAWEDRTGYRAAAKHFAAIVAADSAETTVIEILVEPGLFYNLRTQQAPALIQGDYRFLDNPPPNVTIHVATGPLVGGTAEGRATWDAMREQFTEVARFDAVPLSSIVRLDHPPAIAGQLAHGDESTTYRLFRWNRSNSERGASAP